ncbi:hypothetical protein FRC03_009003 [Tulasnella sp. 419]|nr:hypothetical protein FRC03_009003 [Tulasnella sp. 419]
MSGAIRVVQSEYLSSSSIIMSSTHIPLSNTPADYGATSEHSGLIKQHILPLLGQDQEVLRKRAYDSLGGVEPKETLEHLTEKTLEIKYGFAKITASLDPLDAYLRNYKIDGKPIELFQPSWLAIQADFDNVLRYSMNTAVNDAGYVKQFIDVMVPIIKDDKVPVDSKKKLLLYYISRAEETCNDAKLMTMSLRTISQRISDTANNITRVVNTAEKKSYTTVARLMGVIKVLKLDVDKLGLLQNSIASNTLAVLDVMHRAAYSPTTDSEFYAYMAQVIVITQDSSIILLDYANKVEAGETQYQQKTPVFGPALGGLYVFCCVATRTVVDLAGAVPEDGNKIQGYQANGTLAQQWNLIPKPDGSYEITSSVDGKVFMAYAEDRNHGAISARYAPSRWVLTPVNGHYGTYVFLSQRQFALDLRGSNAANETTIMLCNKHGRSNQQWILQEVM